MRTCDDRKKYFKEYYKKHRDEIRFQQLLYNKKKRGEAFDENNLQTSILYTKEELQNIDKIDKYCFEIGRINWDAWDRIVKETKDIIEYGDIERHTLYNGITRRIYSKDGQLLYSGTAKLLERLIQPHMRLRWQSITAYCNANYYREGLFFTNIYFKSDEQLRKAIKKAISERKSKDLSL